MTMRSFLHGLGLALMMSRLVARSEVIPGLLNQEGLASSLRQSLGFKRVRRNFLCPMPSSLTIPLIFAFLDRSLKRLTRHHIDLSTAPANGDVSIPIGRSAIRNKPLSKYLMSRQTGQKLLITRRLLQSFRCQPVGRDLTFSLLYEYAYKSTANPFEQDSCKLGSVVLEGD
ncbi:hypothetical protein KY284_018377 [Solanum tuberosum]|nr:hypothetical protein KY284_029430 [Solanum tuberosum]KAH0664500.1 hypothetical protein KY284_029431 [Solanum tuberosum]KAH0672267.1 hypothetical protein KY284_023354 [Solanum tuberosum]KAH0687824.1 hypothetical protein KY284_018377 [Solanum tuberosum]